MKMLLLGVGGHSISSSWYLKNRQRCRSAAREVLAGTHRHQSTARKPARNPMGLSEASRHHLERPWSNTITENCRRDRPAHLPRGRGCLATSRRIDTRV